MRFTHATAFNPGETVALTEQAQSAPHLTFSIAVGGEKVLLFSHLAYVSGDLALNILFTVYAGNGRQRPVVKRDQRQRQAG
ncbi:hypothetical protein SEEH2823_24186 [Salmonella enterica subsp. enterica serovar Heidelberg str. 77-2823]|nr:hypothetical protein SEEH2823_24186 [Salmonella enterica subsp. enterica serovar Heidelberg str. 77-2823]